MSKIKTNFRPSKNSEFGKGKLIALILCVGGFFFVKGFVEDASDNAPKKTSLVEVETIHIELKPGELKVFSTKDPKTGRLCKYVALWSVHSTESVLRTSVHNELGKNGVGGYINSVTTYPKSRSNLLYGDYENENVHYVCVENIGPDKVVFSVDLIGYRQVADQSDLEE